MILATRGALAADASLLTLSVHMQIDSLIGKLADARANGDLKAIDVATQALARGTEAFAAQRMNQGIHKALAGKNIESV